MNGNKLRYFVHKTTNGKRWGVYDSKYSSEINSSGCVLVSGKIFTTLAPAEDAAAELNRINYDARSGRIYVASSWRNQGQPEFVQFLEINGYEVYDFRHPAPGNDGFSWTGIDPNWLEWTPVQFASALNHPLAEQGFGLDSNALESAAACILLLPCGRSAHLEAGFALGAGIPTCVFMDQNSRHGLEFEPELMYKWADIRLDHESVLDWLRDIPGLKRKAG